MTTDETDKNTSGMPENERFLTPLYPLFIFPSIYEESIAMNEKQTKTSEIKFILHKSFVEKKLLKSRKSFVSMKIKCRPKVVETFLYLLTSTVNKRRNKL